VLDLGAHRQIAAAGGAERHQDDAAERQRIGHLDEHAAGRDVAGHRRRVAVELALDHHRERLVEAEVAAVLGGGEGGRVMPRGVGRLGGGRGRARPGALGGFHVAADRRAGSLMKSKIAPYPTWRARPGRSYKARPWQESPWSPAPPASSDPPSSADCSPAAARCAAWSSRAPAAPTSTASTSR